MKFKDYICLSHLNIKRNKKRSVRTIVSLVFGIAFSVITLYVLIGFNMSALSHLDNDPKFNMFQVNYVDGDIMPAYSNYQIPFEDRETIRSYEGIDTILCSKTGQAVMSERKDSVDRNSSLLSQTAIVRYDGKEEYIYDGGGICAISNFDIEYFNSYCYKYHRKPFLIDGRFVEKAGEIIVSKDFLLSSNIPLDKAIGYSISIDAYNKFNDAYNEYYDSNGDKMVDRRINILNDMVIVGIYNNFKDNPSPITGYGIVTEDSFYVPKHHIEKDKKIIIGKESEYNKVYYDEDIFNNENRVGRIIKLTPSNKLHTDYVFFNNYKYSHMAYEKIIKSYGDNMVERSVKIDGNYDEYISFHNTIDSITAFMSVISIIIFVVAILNCYEIIGYNILKKKKNLGMIKALGMRDNGMFKMHIIEFSILMFRSTIIAFIISILPAIGLTIYGNKAINYDAIGFDVGFHINIGYYFVSLIIVIFIIYLLVYLYLVIITRKIVKNKAITLLKG